MRINELEHREFDVIVDVMGDKVAVTYLPHAMTPEATRMLEEVEKGRDATQAFLERFCRVVKFWDVQEDGTEDMVALTPERLRNVSLNLLLIVLQATENDKMGRQDDAAKRMWQGAQEEKEWVPTEEEVDKALEKIEHALGETGDEG